MCPMLCQQARHVAVHIFDVGCLVKATGNPGLVGHDRNRHPGPIEPSDCFGCALNELDPADGPDVAVIDDDRPVPVEQDAGTGRGRTSPSSMSSTGRGGAIALT